MGVFLNRTFNDGSVVAVWQITESSGKSLNEQRLAVNTLIDSVFDGKFRLCHDDDGIPLLETSSPAIPAPFVSVSHTRGWVAAMTSPKEHVGVDIELADRDFSAVAKKSLSDSELARIGIWAEVLKNSLPPNTDATPSETVSAINPRNTVLGLIWCAKEAVYKRLTVPATDFANQIEIECIVPTSTANSKEEPKLLCEPRAEGEITAIFKDKTGGAKIQLNCLLLPDLILIHTIN